MEQYQKISKRQRLWLWAAAWGVATLVAIIPHPGLAARLALFFPLGLFGIAYLFMPVYPGFGAFLPDKWAFTIIGAAVAISWVFYLALTIFGLAEERRSRYFVIYAILCVFLILDVTGCHVIMRLPLRT